MMAPESDAARDTFAPIFILGSVRSGTSIVGHALTKGAGIPGDYEGCVIDLLGGMLRLVDQKTKWRIQDLKQHGIMLSRVDHAAFRASLASWFAREYERYADVQGRFIDKTPDADVFYALPTIVSLWPNARFIFTKRRPIENIASRLRKFPEMSFEEHCVTWAAMMRNIEDAKQILPVHTYLELDQYDIATAPQETATRLATFLGLSPDETSRVADAFAYDRPEFTGGDETQVRALDDMPWTLEQKEVFTKVCGPWVEKGGWGLGSVYYQ